MIDQLMINHNKRGTRDCVSVEMGLDLLNVEIKTDS